MENNTRFKKSFIPWNKGKKIGETHPNLGFQKGHKINLGKLLDEDLKDIHLWICRKLGKPNCCEHCKRTDKKWYDWSNKDHKYRKVLEDWQRLCRSCHMKFDFEHNNRTKPKMNQYQLAKLRK